MANPFGRQGKFSFMPPPGRPRRVFSADEAETVGRMLADRVPIWRIAERMGCSRPTLRLYFADHEHWPPPGGWRGD